MSKVVDKECILELFYTTEKEHHLRAIARVCRMNPMTAKKYLESYAGLLTTRRERGNLLYKPNHSALYTLKKRNWNVERIQQSRLINHIKQQLAQPTIVLFGSYAYGENTPESDLDLFILTEEKKELNLTKYEKLFGEIQVFQYNRKEFEQLRKNNRELVNNIINGIVLTGFLEVI